MDEITYPVKCKNSSVYEMVVDAEDRLIAFVTRGLHSESRAKAIVESMNAYHNTPSATPPVAE